MKFSKMLVGLLVFVAMTTNGPAQAQSVQSLDLPPQQSMKDQNDVNWLNAMYEPESRELSIGVEGADLTFVRHNSSGGWGSNMLNSVTYGAYTVTLLLGYSSKVFDRPGTAGNPANDGILRPKDHDGSILTETGSGFTYTARDGSVFSFTKTYQSYSFFGRNAIVATQITRPNGEITSFTYKTYAFPVAGSPSVNELRLQSVNNNRGQQYKFSYAAPNSGVLTSVSAINNAVDYCAPSADACSGFSQSWPTVSFSLSPNAQGGETLLKTDPVGNVWTYAYGTNVDGDLSTETFRRPTEAQDNISVAYKTVAAIDRGDFTHIASPYLLKPFKVKSVTRPGQFWNYAFGKPFGYLWQGTITDPLANVDVFQAQGVVTGTSRIFKDPLNRVTRYELDYYDRYYSATNPELNLATATLDLRGNTTALRRTAKPSTGLADIVSSLALAATCTNYATCNKPNSFTDPLGNRTDYTYDPVHGGLLTETLPPAPNGVRPQKRYSYGQVYAWVKNASGVLVQASSPIWLVTQISECRTTASCVGTADETRTTFGYGAAGTVNAQRVMSKTVASGDGTLSTTTAYTYDAIGNKLTEDGPLVGTADTTRWRYDVMRRVVGVISPDPDASGPRKLRAVRNSYDAIGRLVKVETGTVNSLSDADWAAFVALQSEDTEFDLLDHKVKVTRKGGGTTFAVTQMSYDAAGRLQCTAVRMDPAQWATQTDACTPQLTGPNGPDRVTKLVYNAASEVIKTQQAVGTADAADEETNTYTANGKLASVTDGENNTTTLEYDGHDRLAKTRYPVPTQGALASSTTDYEGLSYDANGNVTQRRLRDGQLINSTFDALNRVTLKDLPSPEVDVSYSYDLLNHVLTATQGSAVSQAYDALGRMTSETTPLGTMGYIYDAASRRIRTTWPDAFFVTQDFDTTGNVTAIRENGVASGVGVLATYTYDDLGKRKTITRGNGAVTNYAYDAVSRLTSLGQDMIGTPSDITATLTYNPASQIASYTRDNDSYKWNGHYNVNRAYTVNGLNQLTTAGATALGYDLRGNLTSSGANLYSYTAENRMITGPAGATLTYDATGRLAQSVGAGLTTRFGYVGTRLTGEYNAPGTLLRRYVHGPGEDDPVVWYEGAGTTDRRWLHSDERGSIIAVSNSAGSVTALNAYDEYGIPAATNMGRFGYTGQAWLPEVGLNYYKARMYSPTLGRFMQTDPVGYKDGINWYAYVANDPVNRSDPTGLYQCDGTKSECGAVSKALNTVRDAVASGKLSKSEVRTLNGVLKTWGAEGKKNGVVVTFRTGAEINKLAGRPATAVTAWSDKYKSAVVVLPHSFGTLYNGQAANPMAGGIRHPDRFSPQDERGNVVAHEGRHAQDQLRAGGYAGTSDANAERRGYEAGRAVNRANGTLPARDLYGPDQDD